MTVERTIPVPHRGRQVALTEFIQQAFGQRTLTLAVTAFLLGLLGNLLASLLGGWSFYGISGNVIITLVVAALVFGLWAWQRAHAVRPEVEIKLCPPQGKAGVIVLLSTLNRNDPAKMALVQATADWVRRSKPRDLRCEDFAPLVGTNLEPAFRALAWHLEKGKLEHCWTIGSPDEPGREDSGSAWLGPILERWFHCAHPSSGVTFHPTRLVPARDYDKLWAAVDEIFREATLKPEHIICDITGGLKLMSVGAALACMEPGRTMQYMDSRRDYKGNPIENGELLPVLIDITPYLVS